MRTLRARASGGGWAIFMLTTHAEQEQHNRKEETPGTRYRDYANAILISKQTASDHRCISAWNTDLVSTVADHGGSIASRSSLLTLLFGEDSLNALGALGSHCEGTLDASRSAIRFSRRQTLQKSSWRLLSKPSEFTGTQTKAPQVENQLRALEDCASTTFALQL